MLKQFENCISLGSNCVMSTFMCRTGLHSFDAPFDWVYTQNFSSIIKLIDNNFIDFLNKENLEKATVYCTNDMYSFQDKKYNISFYHDFCRTYEEVKEKYDRRIDTFLKKIKSPTCFFRIFDDENEVDYINNNQEYIKKIIKKHNINNEVIFLYCGKNKKKYLKNVKNFCINVERRYDLGWYQHKDHSCKMLENKDFCEFIKNILPYEIIEKNKKFYYNGYNSKFGPFIDLKNDFKD